MKHKRLLSCRSQAIRNVGLLVVILALLWASMGYPALFSRQQLRRGEEALLTGGFTVVAREHRWIDKDTVYGQKGNQFLAANDFMLLTLPPSARLYDTENGVLCTFDWKDTVLLLGDLERTAGEELLLTAPEAEPICLTESEWRNGMLCFRHEPFLRTERESFDGDWTAKLTQLDEAGNVVRELEMPWHTR